MKAFFGSVLLFGLFGAGSSQGLCSDLVTALKLTDLSVTPTSDEDALPEVPVLFEPTHSLMKQLFNGAAVTFADIKDIQGKKDPTQPGDILMELQFKEHISSATLTCRWDAKEKCSRLFTLMAARASAKKTLKECKDAWKNIHLELRDGAFFAKSENLKSDWKVFDPERVVKDLLNKHLQSKEHLEDPLWKPKSLTRKIRIITVGLDDHEEEIFELPVIRGSYLGSNIDTYAQFVNPPSAAPVPDSKAKRRTYSEAVEGPGLFSNILDKFTGQRRRASAPARLEYTDEGFDAS